LKNLSLDNVDIRDINLKGFVLRARESGSHSCRVAYGRGKWLTLGNAQKLKPAEARTEARKILGDVARDLDPPSTGREVKAYTWSTYLNEVYAPWLLSKATRCIGATVQRRRVSFKDFECLKLQDITPWHVEKRRSARIKNGITPATDNRAVGDLRSALARAATWEHLATHPLARLKPLKTDKHPKLRYLSPDESSRLRAALAARDAKLKSERGHATS
jgi:hypothetical protein